MDTRTERINNNLRRAAARIRKIAISTEDITFEARDRREYMCERITYMLDEEERRKERLKPYRTTKDNRTAEEKRRERIKGVIIAHKIRDKRWNDYDVASLRKSKENQK